MDPFTLTEKDGYFYGRGVGDDKAQAAVWIANLIRYKREGFKPDRDIIVALTADEEGGGPYNGVEWLLKNKRELIDAEFCLNEGGWGESVAGTRLVERPSGEREVRHQLPARGAQQGRAQLAAGRGQRDLPSRRRARPAVELRVSAQDERRSRANISARCRASRRAPIRTDLAAVAKGDAAAMTARRGGVDVMERDAAHDLRRDAARGRPRQERAAAARGGERQLSRAAGRLDRLRDGDAQARDRRHGGDAHDRRHAAHRAGLADARRPDERGRSGHDAAVARRARRADDGDGRDGRPYLRSAGIPTYGIQGFFYDRDDIRFHGRDERLKVQSFYEGQTFLYELVKRLSGGPAV